MFEGFFALDGNILLWIQEYVRADWMNGFWRLITSLGNGGLFWIGLGIVMLVFKKYRLAGGAGLLSMALNYLITNLTLKELVARPRPYTVLEELTILIDRPGEFSFPSGHTSCSFAFAVAIYLLLPKKYGVPAMVLATLIAVSRLYVGVHYPTDVLGGLIIGYLSSVAAYYLVTYVRKKLGARKTNG